MFLGLFNWHLKLRKKCNTNYIILKYAYNGVYCFHTFPYLSLYTHLIKITVTYQSYPIDLNVHV